MMPLVDLLGRPLRSLRVSVTDRCNLRCQYCMPEAEYTWLPREDLLHLRGDRARSSTSSLACGVDKVRLTGGEPLLRRDLPELVRLLAADGRLADLALTTNGVLLAEQAEALRAAGLQRVTVSLDTLRPDRFTALTRLTSHAARARRDRAAARALRRRSSSTPSSCAASTTTNSCRSSSTRASGAARSGSSSTWTSAGATRWSAETRSCSRAEILQRLEAHYGALEPIDATAWAPADRFRLPDGTIVRRHRLDDDALLLAPATARA